MSLPAALPRPLPCSRGTDRYCRSVFSPPASRRRRFRQLRADTRPVPWRRIAAVTPPRMAKKSDDKMPLAAQAGRAPRCGSMQGTVGLNRTCRPAASVDRSLEQKPAILEVDRNHVLRADLSLQQQFGDRILDLLLDRPFQRACAVHRVESNLRQLGQRRVADHQLQVLCRQTRLQTAQLDSGDRFDLVAIERLEHDDLVDSVDEFRPKMLRTSAITASLIRSGSCPAIRWIS